MLRVWTKLYNAFNTGQISVLGSAMWECGETERQKLNNLISSPLFTSSPPLFTFSSPLISSHLSPRHLSSHVTGPRFLKSHRTSLPHFNTLLSLPCLFFSPCPTPILTLSLLPTSSLQSNLQICIHIKIWVTFWQETLNHLLLNAQRHNHYTSFFKQKMNKVCAHFCQF